MMNIWFGGSEAYFSRGRHLNPAAQVLGIRRMEHADLPCLGRLIRSETHAIFGDVDIGRIYEASCLSVVQCTRENDIVSGICLCNYPNVPSVTPSDWLSWLYALYKVEHVTERNALFLHFLVWDKRYTGHFFNNLLSGLFDVVSHLQHVLFVLPPLIIMADVFEGQMIRIPPRCVVQRPSIQSIFMTKRHQKNSRLRIRRVVVTEMIYEGTNFMRSLICDREEDNDDVIPIIHAETGLLKEFYGEYYVSEMVRYPDKSRRLFVSEDDEGLATGVMFLNSTIDVDTLNENFELGPYNGLRKSHENDQFPPGFMNPASETFSEFFSKRPRIASKVLLDESMESFEDREEVSMMSIDDLSLKQVPSMDQSQKSSTTVPRSSFGYVGASFQSKIMTSDFLDSMVEIMRKRTASPTESSESLSFKELKAPPQPSYYGDQNAFVLEIFATQDHIKRRWSKNFVEAAFECFPDLDYCALLLPFAHPFLPVLEHFVVRWIVERSGCNKDYPMTLYVTHRAALLGQIKLRDGKPSDRDEVQELVQRIPKMEKILADFDEAVREERTDLYCYVCQWNDTIVGVAILCIETEVTYIQRRYHVEDYIAVQHIPRDAYGRILHFVLMPIFSIHQQYFFCEIMRFSGLIVLYYKITENALSALTRMQPLTVCLNAMVPVNPRVRIEYKYHGFVETDEPENAAEHFSLCMTTPRLALMPNTIIESKIVVVGASDCGVGFLESLVYGQSFVRFANLTLISPNGLPFENDYNSIAARMVPFRGKYCREYRQVVGLRAWINIVYGTVISIQRKEKYVAVMNQGNIAYDHLILTCGMQYQGPQFQHAYQKKGEVDEIPWNCLTINDDFEAATCLEKLRTLTNGLKDEKRIVLYGHNIDCYCALQGLLEFGIPGSWITLIQPPLPQCDSHDSIFFNQCEICVEVMNAITSSNIEILVGWELIDWTLRGTTEEKMIESLGIRLKGKTRTIDCDALVSFHEKTISMKIFLAICRSGLVYDGHLVIDPDFRTNDSAIFAAGTVTKYCRKFHADAWQHDLYNQAEIGGRVAKILRTFINEQHEGDEAPFEPFKSKKYLDIPVFRSPKVVACILPGAYKYLHVYTPGKLLRRRLAIRYNLYGQVLATGSCTSDIGYFRIRLNRFGTVESLTCFHKKNFEVRQMILLYGKHESLLNELKTRFEKSLIVDLYAYFREPWAMAILYDRFECLRVENRATLLSKTVIPGHSLTDDCVRVLAGLKWNALGESERRSIQARYAGSVYQHELEENLMNFLEFCKEDLPVYCTPGKLCELYADIEDSPLYTDI